MILYVIAPRGMVLDCFQQQAFPKWKNGLLEGFILAMQEGVMDLAVEVAKVHDMMPDAFCKVGLSMFGNEVHIINARYALYCGYLSAQRVLSITGLEGGLLEESHALTKWCDEVYEKPMFFESLLPHSGTEKKADGAGTETVPAVGESSGTHENPSA
jgi:hypothetical protein